MIRAAIFFTVAVAVFCFAVRVDREFSAHPTPPIKTETLTCVRVKEVTPAGTINYLCEVRK